MSRSMSVLALLLLCSCADVLGLNESEPKQFDAIAGSTSMTPRTGLNFGWMSNGGPSSFYNTSRNGAILAGQELTSFSGSNVSVSILDPADGLAATQAKRIEDAVASGIDALAVDVVDPTVIGPEIDKAVAAGVTVMTFDSDAPGSKRISYYGIDNAASGVVSAKILASLMPRGGNIIIMDKDYPPSSANYIARRDGFVGELANHSGFNVVADLPCTDGANGEVTTQAGCTGGLEQAVKDHPEVTGWYLARGRALREADLANEAPTWTAKVKSGAFSVVGYDAVPESLANIESGYVNAAINQKYFGWGYDVMNLLYGVVLKKKSINPFTDSGFDVVCSNNIAEVERAWTLQNFSKAITKCSLAGSTWP